MNDQTTRRETLSLMGALALASSFQFQGRAAGSPPDQQGIAPWLADLHKNAGRLRDKSISSLNWQEAMDVLYAEAPIEGLKHHLGFDRLRREILDRISPSRGELFHRVALSGRTSAVGGKEPHSTLITKVAHIKKGRSIPPHGHSNMTSAFLCISGEFSVRLYDKLEETADEMVLRQTVDKKCAGVGTWSSISDYRDNVHWLTAETDDCFLFTCKLIGVETGRPLQGRINVDLHRSHSLGNTTMRAPKITSKEAAELY